MALVSRAHVLAQGIRAAERGAQVFVLKGDFVKQQVSIPKFADLVRFQKAHAITAAAGGIFVLRAVARIGRSAVYRIARVAAGVGNQGPGIRRLGCPVRDLMIQHLTHSLQDFTVPAVGMVEDRRVGEHREQAGRVVHPPAPRENRVLGVVRPVEGRVGEVSPVAVELHRDLFECLPCAPDDTMIWGIGFDPTEQLPVGVKAHVVPEEMSRLQPLPAQQDQGARRAGKPAGAHPNQSMDQGTEPPTSAGRAGDLKNPV